MERRISNEILRVKGVGNIARLSVISMHYLKLIEFPQLFNAGRLFPWIFFNGMCAIFP